MEHMRKGTSAIFTNQLGEAEEILSSGCEHEEGYELLEGERDLRGAFALQRALATVIRGVASLSDDQLDECRERLFEADKLVADSTDPHWVGKNVVRGVTTTFLSLCPALYRQRCANRPRSRHKPSILPPTPFAHSCIIILT